MSVDLGEKALKNIARPVRDLRCRPILPAQRNRGRVGRARRRSSPRPLPRASIAVLPFANMSGDAEQEYFADGISEDIITALSKLGQLFVIARNSSFTFKGRNVHVGEVAKSLGVRHVLEGSVRKSGSRVRITAQLIDATTGGHLWAERFDRELTDIFAVQDDVTAHIVSALTLNLSAGDRQSIAAERTDNHGSLRLLPARARAVVGVLEGGQPRGARGCCGAPPNSTRALRRLSPSSLRRWRTTMRTDGATRPQRLSKRLRKRRKRQCGSTNDTPMRCGRSP